MIIRTELLLGLSESVSQSDNHSQYTIHFSHINPDSTTQIGCIFIIINYHSHPQIDSGSMVYLQIFYADNSKLIEGRDDCVEIGTTFQFISNPRIS